MVTLDDVKQSEKNLEWLDLSNEEWREYIFPNGYIARIERPIALSLKPRYRKWGGLSHRIVSEDGTSHYIPPGWIHLRWRSKDSSRFAFDY